MQNPAYKVKIGSKTFDSSTSQDIISVNIDSDINIPASSFKILFKPGTNISEIKNGDAVVIELGYQGTLKKVLTGTVGTIESKISGVLIDGLSIASILTGKRINQVYEKQTAGAIINDIISEAGISARELENGLSFPMYVVDDTKNLYEHMKELSQKCGFDLFLTGDGRLVFKKYARQTPKPFKYGRDIIEAEVYEPSPFTASVRVYGESPSSFKGADTAHLKSKKVVEGVAGSGAVSILIEDPLIRDNDTAQKVATAWLETFLTPFVGTIMVLGNARVEPGDTIEIKEMPDERMNGEFEVTGANHIFTKNEGFVSTFDWAKKITISPAEPPLAAPPQMPAPPKPPSPLEEQLETANEALENSRLELLDAVETAELNLEEILAEINNAMNELDRMAAEMMAAAEEAKEAAMEAVMEALAKAEELKQELEARKKEIEAELAKAWDEYEKFKKEAEDQINKYEQEIEDTAAEKLKPIRGEMENKIRELEDTKEQMLNKTGPAREEAEKRVADLESAVGELKEKREHIDKELMDGKQKIEDTVSELKDREAELEKEVEDMEKQVKENAEKAIQKLEEMTKGGEDQINEFKQTAEVIEKEADAMFVKAREKTEEAKKKAQEKLEEVKKAYNEARDKVLESRKQAGLD